MNQNNVLKDFLRLKILSKLEPKKIFSKPIWHIWSQVAIILHRNE